MAGCWRWDQGGNPVREVCVGLGKSFAGDNRASVETISL